MTTWLLRLFYTIVFILFLPLLLCRLVVALIEDKLRENDDD